MLGELYLTFYSPVLTRPPRVPSELTLQNNRKKSVNGENYILREWKTIVHSWKRNRRAVGGGEPQWWKSLQSKSDTWAWSQNSHRGSSLTPACTTITRMQIQNHPFPTNPILCLFFFFNLARPICAASILGVAFQGTYQGLHSYRKQILPLPTANNCWKLSGGACLKPKLSERWDRKIARSWRAAWNM